VKLPIGRFSNPQKVSSWSDVVHEGRPWTCRWERPQPTPPHTPHTHAHHAQSRVPCLHGRCQRHGLWALGSGHGRAAVFAESNPVHGQTPRRFSPFRSSGRGTCSPAVLAVLAVKCGYTHSLDDGLCSAGVCVFDEPVRWQVAGVACISTPIPTPPLNGQDALSDDGVSPVRAMSRRGVASGNLPPPFPSRGLVR
jgi:hypothetical protein